MYRNITSTIFQKKIVSRTYGDPKFGRRGRGVSYFEARIKVPERRSGFRPSEKERQERRSDAFCHRSTPGYNCIFVCDLAG